MLEVCTSNINHTALFASLALQGLALLSHRKIGTAQLSALALLQLANLLGSCFATHAGDCSAAGLGKGLEANLLRLGRLLFHFGCHKNCAISNTSEFDAKYQFVV